MDLEEILKEIGVGKYHIIICFALCLAQMFSDLSPLLFIFTAFDVNYRCSIPQCETTNSEVASTFLPQWLPDASPYLMAEPSTKCLRYAAVNETFENAMDQVCPSQWFDRYRLIACPTEELVFETAEKTAVNEFGLFCDENQWKIFMVGTANCIGQFFGLPIFGVFSDKYGRKKVLILMTLASAICGIAQSFSASYFVFVLLEGLNAFVSVGIYGTSLILAVELFYAKRRTLAGAIVCSISPCIAIAIALTQKYTQDWRLTLRYCYFPGLLFISYFWLIPESVRWMSFQGKHEKVINFLSSLAKMNKTKFSESAKNELMKKPIPEDGKSVFEAFMYILQKKTLILRFINSVVCWITVTFVYYGLSVQSVNISDDKYSDFMIAIMIEAPAIPLNAYLMEILGRKLTMSSTFAITGAALIFHCVFLEFVTIKLALFMLAKVSISMAFCTIYVFTLEIYPTELRQSLLGLCSMMGRFGFIFAVIAPRLVVIWRPLPILTLGVCSLVAATLTLSFPETQNQRLPDTVEEAVILEETVK